jgi:hypothetical protein
MKQLPLGISGKLGVIRNEIWPLSLEYLNKKSSLVIIDSG